MEEDNNKVQIENRCQCGMVINRSKLRCSVCARVHNRSLQRKYKRMRKLALQIAGYGEGI